MFGVVNMFMFKRPKHEILLQLLAAHNALKKIILNYFRGFVEADLQQRIQALLSLPNLPSGDAETLSHISKQLHVMSTRRLVKMHYKIEKMERQMRQQNKPD